jgi:hypothetical protein
MFGALQETEQLYGKHAVRASVSPRQRSDAAAETPDRMLSCTALASLKPGDA